MKKNKNVAKGQRHKVAKAQSNLIADGGWKMDDGRFVPHPSSLIPHSSLCLCAFVPVLICSFAAIAGPVPERYREGQTYALVVSGISKNQDALYHTVQGGSGLAKTAIIANLRAFLLDKAAVAGENLTVLTAENPRTISSEENLHRTFDALETSIKPLDRFIFYYIGQANVVGDKLRFNLPGADVTQEQLAQWLGQINTASMLVVLDCPASGLAVKAISKAGRVVICSCTEEQQYRTRLSEYFIPALTDSNSDTNGDGKISVLEAFTGAVKQVDDWFLQNKLMITETPVLEDNADGRTSKEPWKFQLDGMDGRVASQFFLTGKL